MSVLLVFYLIVEIYFLSTYLNVNSNDKFIHRKLKQLYFINTI